MPYRFLERNWVYIIIGELWRYKNETLHAFLKAQNSSDATVIDAAAAIKYCMIKYKKEMYGECFPNEIWNAFCVWEMLQQMRRGRCELMPSLNCSKNCNSIK